MLQSQTEKSPDRRSRLAKTSFEQSGIKIEVLQPKDDSGLVPILLELEPVLDVRAGVAHVVPLAHQRELPVQEILDAEVLFRRGRAYVGRIRDVELVLHQ